MKKNISRWVCLLLVAVLLTGCTPPIFTNNTTINDVDIGEYTIVYSAEDLDYSKRAAEYIQTQILERTGITVPLQEASSGSFPYEIVVGDTGREISQKMKPTSTAMEFYLLADENHIAINADYFMIAAAAYYFVETYIPGNKFRSNIAREVTTATPITEKANNYILLIGDGMGFNHTKMFEYMQVPGETADYDGENVFYGYYLPYQGKIQTDSLSGVTDSAAAATALATGYKTLNGRVGKSSVGNDLQSLTELAASLDMATAVMSTDTLTGATPAGFFAHAMDRDDSAVIGDYVAEKVRAGMIISCDLDVDKYYQENIADILSRLEENETGFFVMYEEGHIDKHSHNNDETLAFSSVIRFNQAIGLFMEYAFYHPDTMVLITADHETGGLSLEEGSLVYTTDSHTGALVPIFGYGQGAEVFHNQRLQNNEIPKHIASLWGVSDFGE